MTEMDFDLTKENIQPLRGGRNTQQLAIALQAQSSREIQLELMQQKEEFERAINSYQGDDPLDNYYHYISWIEQSFPKNGHEGNLGPLLEHCLHTFENDPRYTNDRRFCKLWIKYIDLHTNPLELYHMMHAKGIGIGCADLYRAWAYYHEAAGDFQSAHNVFELGKRAIAQPYDELETAHKNLVIAAGHHTIFGRDETNLVEKRQALTSLHTYRPGRVGNTRTPSGSGAGILPTTHNPVRANAAITVYEGENMFGQAEAAPTSIIAAARRQDMPKENVLKPGPWTTVPDRKRAFAPKRTAGFTVHEDGAEDLMNQFFSNIPKQTLEDYTSWKVPITIPEPADPRMVPKYPKDRVYIDPQTEYSIEELRARRYLKSKEASFNIETDQAVQSILNLDDMDDIGAPCNASALMSQNMLQRPENLSIQYGSPVVCPYVAQPVTSTKFNIWESSPTEQEPGVKFRIYESPQESSRQPKGTAMKTPIKCLNADDLVETGSRGGMDVAAMAQPTDSAKPMPTFSDNSSSSFKDLCDSNQLPSVDLNNSCDTQMFNFNLNTMPMSTPQSKRPIASAVQAEQMATTRKELFTEPQAPEREKFLSTIYEETKSFATSSSSSGASSKSSVTQHTKQQMTNMATISEEHNSYLAQNLMANADLRRGLLGEIMDFDAPAPAVVATPTTSMQTYCSSVRPARVVPVETQPLWDTVPSDPFAPSVINNLLRLVDFPGNHSRGYIELTSNPRLAIKKEPVTIGCEKYLLEKQLGKGTYGTVFKALDLANNQHVALKYQKCSNKWEYYICRELRARLAENVLRDRFMDVQLGYFSDQWSILVSKFMPFGSLLDIANLIKQKSGKMMKESLVIYFTIEMLRIVNIMHQMQIIHADIKPDNFLAFLLPDNTIGLQLIDFGCSIDMKLFPPNATFSRAVTTEGFICCEMRENRRWSYHTDLFCVAATTHVLLFDKYIEVVKRDHWSITGHYPRYVKKDMWDRYFHTLLNQSTGPVDAVATVKSMLDNNLAIVSLQSDCTTEMRYLINLLKKR